MVMVQQKSLPGIHAFQPESFQPWAELPALCRFAEEVKVPRSPWLDWCPRAKGMAQGTAHHWSPKTTDSPLQDAESPV